MGRTRKQNLIFTIMMCCSMVLIMSLYNAVLNDGLTDTMLHAYWTGFIPTLCVAILWEMLIVVRIAKPLFFKYAPRITSPKRKPWLMSVLMVVGMVLGMTAYGLMVNEHAEGQFASLYALGIVRNLIVALPIQIFVVSPLIRKLFHMMFPLPVRTETNQETV
ncbi:uncharacterized protein DUF2798 [Paenibacillus cellulosilyticus]|uniref:Uncharacterized protein DUF2798 n=1 Tax=Paenibacillus cellulosilyticus TaxID=375489 RepID=A0A2V2YEH2_9BACL|nr:DUF2798 domain-containing protein [Paenibacillus cellulosilyticus]PWV90590.1 uncharacterized protein DUF2798 [Paenibacillus cellulosilyticus]QKS45245.1 DUF2798 domain-containing protein [Paenibacillus cellulosilyticus]